MERYVEKNVDKGKEDGKGKDSQTHEVVPETPAEKAGYNGDFVPKDMRAGAAHRKRGGGNDLAQMGGPGMEGEAVAEGQTASSAAASASSASSSATTAPRAATQDAGQNQLGILQ